MADTDPETLSADGDMVALLTTMLHVMTAETENDRLAVVLKCVCELEMRE
jgi:hypothetical protein